MMKTPTLMPWDEIVAQLKPHRERLGLSLRNLSSVIGVSPSQLMRLERGLSKTHRVSIWMKLSDWMAGGRVENDPTYVAVVGPEGALPHIQHLVASDPALDRKQQKALNIFMTEAYRICLEVQNARS